jgi:hypothetical protein
VSAMHTRRLDVSTVDCQSEPILLVVHKATAAFCAAWASSGERALAGPVLDHSRTLIPPAKSETLRPARGRLRRARSLARDEAIVKRRASSLPMPLILCATASVKSD